MNRIALSLAWVVGFLVVTNHGFAGTLLDENFDADDGGFAVVNTGGVQSPWAYDAAAGSWSVDGSTDVGSPTSSGLTSPTVTATADGSVTVSFEHLYNWELDNTVWDGGAVFVSINGGAFEHATEHPP